MMNNVTNQIIYVIHLKARLACMSDINYFRLMYIMNYFIEVFKQNRESLKFVFIFC